MPQGKKAFIDTPEKKRLSLPRSLCEAVDRELEDPFKQKPKYGGWSGLVAALLRRWLDEQRRTGSDIRTRGEQALNSLETPND